MNGRKKVTVVGAGNVGATCAFAVARSDYADVVLVDIIEGFPQGKALDMNQAGSVLGFEPSIVGTNRYEETAGSDVVVITAGRPRSPGMSRDDLVTTNEAIVGSVTREIVKRSPKAVLVVVSNPLDAMCHVAKTASRFPKERVVGMAGILDTARFAAFISWETGQVRQGRAGHGARRARRPDGPGRLGDDGRRRAARAAHHEDPAAKMVERTRKGGGELVDLLGTSAWYAPGEAAAQMVDAICLDQKRVLPCTAYLEGEYGIDGLYMGVPVVLGAAGVEEIVPLRLTADEKKMLRASAAAVREVVGVLSKPVTGSACPTRSDTVSVPHLALRIRTDLCGALNSPASTLRRMDLGLTGRTAIVCGASSGMGLAVSEALRAESANVVMLARRADLLEQEAGRIGAVPVAGDLTRPDDVETLVTTAVDSYGGVDVLVLNGGGPPPGPGGRHDARGGGRRRSSCSSSATSGSSRDASPISVRALTAGSSRSSRRR